ncbi:formylglycine-generating enzyme family protein [Cellulomonas sp. S1-8]|uniref:formylglycine-generating enzyme family protein n=1 Tax=Cellulomonas sp. S1-8 TaxID=2904790 RepID=UPI0022439B0D|nr:SUMF1/EgtB/PvdO family nonheme iron enzyme [Cellulomonas sp. S1-8]UZN01732.1 formylglycine-generating enzyme family protein [Cellulomonas sp. S1-8]
MPADSSRAPVPGPRLETIPAGRITLRDARTATTREVVLRTFSLATTPVTWAQYAHVREQGVPDGQAPDAPVHSVSWLDAVAWCNAASQASGRQPAYDLDGPVVVWDVSADGLRLPTEAEWEHACRAGTDGPRYGPLAEIAWTAADAVDGPQRVGGKRANAWGLLDMLGNVWEWCWDHADTARYADYRTLRGGGWADAHWSVRAGVRRGSMPGARLDDLGFRVAQGAVGAAGDHAAQGWSRLADEQRADVPGRPHGWTPLR